jgi:hypothetical protein
VSSSDLEELAARLAERRRQDLDDPEPERHRRDFAERIARELSIAHARRRGIPAFGVQASGCL